MISGGLCQPHPCRRTLLVSQHGFHSSLATRWPGAIEEAPMTVTEKAYTDILLTCRECGEHFTWTAGEQEFYVGQGLKNPPARCGPCREARKAAQNADPRPAPAFGGGRPGGNGFRPAYGGEQRGPHTGALHGHTHAGGISQANGGYAGRPARVLFDTICAECGQATQVPFQPRGDRLVYCRACFDRRRANGQY